MQYTFDLVVKTVILQKSAAHKSGQINGQLRYWILQFTSPHLSWDIQIVHDKIRLPILKLSVLCL